jgi:2-succinyl-5-enolpyruvyl-6-hydroxy-3-cyclohexene-1-carboxylate synthase
VNPATAHAQVIVDELARCGITDAVLCPGSRNAPLAFALHAADAAGRLRLHVRIDERTAGFLALGLALRSGRPVPVVTTSGTAVANLHPAVLEASHAGVPLVVLTADRPPQLIGTGANQTITQPGIFGGAVRLALTAAPAVDPVRENGSWRAAVDRAVAAALGAPAGPVHVNVPFAEPLVPSGGDDAPAGRAGGAPWTAIARLRTEAGPLPLDPAARTLVIAGAHTPAAVRGWPLPVVAEPASGVWDVGLRSGPWLLGALLGLLDQGLPDDLLPDQVVVAGRPTLHRPVQRLLADPRVAVFALADPAGRGWTDVAGTVRAVGTAPRWAPPPDWAERWRDADADASKALDVALDDRGAPGGLRLARVLVDALPADALLVVGSSNPIRDLSLAAVPRPDVRVLANRGVAGIDGTVSTAVGAALAHSGPAYAMLGDLTLLHDTTGLVIGPDEPHPDLTIVVLNDGGGGIFGLLEQGAAKHAGVFERVFGTPHRVDLAALAAAMGVGHTRVDDPADVAAALAPAPGLRLVEVRADRTTLRAGHAAVRASVTAALGPRA